MPSNNVLIIVTGSVAAIKLPFIVQMLRDLVNYEVNIKVVATQNAMHFIKNQEFQYKPEIFEDHHEWELWNGRGDPVLHIDLRKWADIGLIAPIDANTLAKVANGLCDNLATCILRAWDFSKPLLFAPAMNTLMYSHPITGFQIETLKTWGFKEIPVIEKVLMCKDKGLGAMANPEDIVARVVQELSEKKF